MNDAFVDGARVICRAVGHFGVGYDGREIASLVIAQYDDSKDSAYLFACSAEGDVVGDLLYSSIEEARIEAVSFYEVVGGIDWVDA